MAFHANTFIATMMTHFLSDLHKYEFYLEFESIVLKEEEKVEGDELGGGIEETLAIEGTGLDLEVGSVTEGVRLGAIIWSGRAPDGCFL